MTPDKKILGISEPFPGYNIADVVATVGQDSSQSVTKLVNILRNESKAVDLFLTYLYVILLSLTQVF